MGWSSAAGLNQGYRFGQPLGTSPPKRTDSGFAGDTGPAWAQGTRRSADGQAGRQSCEARRRHRTLMTWTECLMWMRCKALQEAIASCPVAGSAGAKSRSGRAPPPGCLCLGRNQFRGRRHCWDQYCELPGPVVSGSGLVTHARDGRDPGRYCRRLWDPRDYLLWGA